VGGFKKYRRALALLYYLNLDSLFYDIMIDIILFTGLPVKPVFAKENKK
jgi:hypothetical protein